MESTRNAIEFGMTRVLKTFVELPCLGSIHAKAPSQDAYEPDFWYPGEVWAEIEDSDVGRRFGEFLETVQGALEFPMEGLRSFEIARRDEGEKREVVVRLHLFDPKDLDEVFTWLSRHLQGCWRPFLDAECL